MSTLFIRQKIRSKKNKDDAIQKLLANRPKPTSELATRYLKNTTSATTSTLQPQVPARPLPTSEATAADTNDQILSALEEVSKQQALFALESDDVVGALLLHNSTTKAKDLTDHLFVLQQYRGTRAKSVPQGVYFWNIPVDQYELKKLDTGVASTKVRLLIKLGDSVIYDSPIPLLSLYLLMSKDGKYLKDQKGQELLFGVTYEPDERKEALKAVWTIVEAINRKTDKRVNNLVQSEKFRHLFGDWSARMTKLVEEHKGNQKKAINVLVEEIGKNSDIEEEATDEGYLSAEEDPVDKGVDQHPTEYETIMDLANDSKKWAAQGFRGIPYAKSATRKNMSPYRLEIYSSKSVDPYKDTLRFLQNYMVVVYPKQDEEAYLVISQPSKIDYKNTKSPFIVFEEEVSDEFIKLLMADDDLKVGEEEPLFKTSTARVFFLMIRTIYSNSTKEFQEMMDQWRADEKYQKIAAISDGFEPNFSREPLLDLADIDQLRKTWDTRLSEWKKINIDLATVRKQEDKDNLLDQLNDITDEMKLLIEKIFKLDPTATPEIPDSRYKEAADERRAYRKKKKGTGTKPDKSGLEKFAKVIMTPPAQSLASIFKGKGIKVVNDDLVYTYKTDKQLLNRLKVIIGAFEAGNDSILIRNHISKIGDILLQKELITQPVHYELMEKYVL